VTGHNTSPSPIPSLYALISIRWKIIFTLSFLIAVVTPRVLYPRELIVYVTILVLWSCLARPPAKILLLRAAALLPFFIMVFTAALFTAGGGAIFSINAAVTGQGAQVYSQLILKAVLSLYAVIVLTVTERRSALFQGLRSLRVPKTLTGIIFITLRYIDVIGSQLKRMRRARTARTVHLSLRQRYTLTGAFIGGLFIRSIQRSHNVYRSMLARGYDGGTFPAPALPGRSASPLRQAAAQSAGVLLFLLLGAAKILRLYYGS